MGLVTTFARSGASYVWHIATDRYVWVCGHRARVTACGAQVLPDRTQLTTERPATVCAACLRAKS